MNKSKPAMITVWVIGTELWVVDVEAHKICPARVVDVWFDEDAKRRKLLEPVYKLVWAGLLWSGPNNTFVYDRAFLFERTPEGTKAAVDCLRGLIQEDIDANKSDLKHYQDKADQLAYQLLQTFDTSCFNGLSNVERRKLHKQLESS